MIESPPYFGPNMYANAVLRIRSYAAVVFELLFSYFLSFGMFLTAAAAPAVNRKLKEAHAKTTCLCICLDKQIFECKIVIIFFPISFNMCFGCS